MRFPIPIAYRLSIPAAIVFALTAPGVWASSIQTTAAPSPSTYQVGPEDVITVLVNRHPEFSGDFYIPADGVVSFPAAGQVAVNDKTLADITRLVQAGLGSRLRDPEVNVTLKTPRMQRVYVLGAVDKPGLYDLKQDWRITEAMAAAGGLTAGTEPVDCSAIVLRAATGQREATKLADALRGDPKANLIVHSGDVVTVEPKEALPVYVMGKVRSPGLYKLRQDTAGIMQALTLAGGVTEDSALDRVTVTHLGGRSETINLLSAIRDGKQDETVKVLAGDLVVVPEDTSRIAVLGYVRDPGYFTVKNGQRLMLSDALGLAKGVDKRANVGSVLVMRTQDGKQTRLVFDFHRFLKMGDMGSNPEIRPGDVVYVPQTGRPDGESILRSLSIAGLLLGPFVP